MFILCPPKSSYLWSFLLTTLHCLATTIQLSNGEISFDIWALGVMICLSNFCICISSQEFPYFKHCRPPSFDPFQQILHRHFSQGKLHICIIFIMRQIHLYFRFSTSQEFQFWLHPSEVQISTAKYLPNIQTTLGGNDPNLKLRRPGRPGQPGQDDQHHGEHGVGGVGPVLDQHEVGWDPSSLFARCPVPTTQSKAWHIAKHQTYRSIIYPLANIYLYTVHIYIQTCLGCSKLWL